MKTAVDPVRPYKALPEYAESGSVLCGRKRLRGDFIRQA